MTQHHGTSDTKPQFRHLLSGIDTLEVCFYLSPGKTCALDFEALLARKEALRSARFRQPEEIRIGSESFLLQAYGSSSGYPLVFSNPWAVISYGARNSPPFYVKFLSQGLWQYGWAELVAKFLGWAQGAGFDVHAPERISRADFCFDYWIADVDFDQNSFVSLSAKDANYRQHQKNQTFDFGKGDLKLRVYDKGGKIHGYYTCQKKLSQGSKACPSRRVPLTVLEHLVLTTFAEQILVPERLQAIMVELEKAVTEGSAGEQARVRDLQRRLKEKDEALANLMEAIEKKILPLDEITRQRAQAHQTARLEILGEIGRLRATQGPKINFRSPRHIRAFSQATRTRLFDKSTGFGKSYLNALVTDITVGAEGIVMRGSKEALAAAICDMTVSADGVRSSMRVWRAIPVQNCELRPGSP